MGGKSSKIAGAAGSTVVRKYPTRTPTQFPSSQTTNASGPSGSESISPETTARSEAQAEFSKTEAIKQDAADPDFASMLRSVGVAQIPDAARNYDLAGVENPQLRTLTRRQALEDEQLEEANNPATRMKRSWIDAPTLREVLKMRDDQKWSAEKIEKEMGLASGVMARLGKRVKGF